MRKRYDGWRGPMRSSYSLLSPICIARAQSVPVGTCSLSPRSVADSHSVRSLGALESGAEDPRPRRWNAQADQNFDTLGVRVTFPPEVSRVLVPVERPDADLVAKKIVPKFVGEDDHRETAHVLRARVTSRAIRFRYSERGTLPSLPPASANYSPPTSTPCRTPRRTGGHPSRRWADSACCTFPRRRD